MEGALVVTHLKHFTLCSSLLSDELMGLVVCRRNMRMFVLSFQVTGSDKDTAFWQGQLDMCRMKKHFCFNLVFTYICLIHLICFRNPFCLFKFEFSEFGRVKLNSTEFGKFELRSKSNSIPLEFHLNQIPLESNLFY